MYGAVTLIASCLQLKYYHSKNYKVAFKMGTAVTVISFFQFVVFYLLLTARLLQELYLPVTFLLIIASASYGILLAFSESGKRRWLKTGGIFIAIACIVLLVTAIRTMLPDVDVDTKITLENFVQWASAANAIAPIFFLANLLDENKKLKVLHIFRGVPSSF